MSNDTKELTLAQKLGDAPLPHPLTPEANKPEKAGEISDPKNAAKASAAVNKNNVGKDKELDNE